MLKHMILTNWRTTVWGIAGGFVNAFIANIVVGHATIGSAFLTAAAGIIPAIKGILAKDAVVTGAPEPAIS